MERNFKKEIQEAASNPIDMAEMMAQLVQVRRREKQKSFPVLITGRSRIYPFNCSHEREFLYGEGGLMHVVPPSQGSFGFSLFPVQICCQDCFAQSTRRGDRTFSSPLASSV